MTDQCIITDAGRNAARAAAVDRHSGGLIVAAFVEAVADVAIEAAAPHIAAQALRQAAGDLALSTYHHECAAAVQARLTQLADAALVATGPGSAAPTRTGSGGPKPPPDTSWIRLENDPR